MLPKANVFLGRVIYVPEKRQVVAEFSNHSEKYSARYPFFPKMFFPMRGVSSEALKQVLSQYDLRRLKYDIEGGKATIFAATFSDLKKINNLLGECFGFFSNPVEPERQFLIERCWGYFEPFSLESGEPKKVLSNAFPELSFGFLDGSLHDNVSGLVSSDRRLAGEFISKMALSRLLKVPLMDAESDIAPVDIFLENVFFAGGVPLSYGKKTGRRAWLRSHEKAEVDFSRLVSVAVAMPFNNLGPESLNCACCRPLSLSGGNALPSSLVKVKFLKEGFYFNSCSASWANSFHSSHAEKDLRDRRKREYFYHSYPVGPFFRGEEADVLLADALQLEGEGNASIVGDAAAMWCCSKEESVLSRELNSLKNLLLSIHSSMESERVSLVASKGLFFAQSLDSSPVFFYSQALSDTASSILSAVPAALCEPNSRFFSMPLAVSIECITGGIMREFESIAGSAGEVPKHVQGHPSMLVDSSSLMEISRRFSGLYMLGKPFISIKTHF